MLQLEVLFLQALSFATDIVGSVALSLVIITLLYKAITVTLYASIKRKNSTTTEDSLTFKTQSETVYNKLAEENIDGVNQSIDELRQINENLKVSNHIIALATLTYFTIVVFFWTAAISFFYGKESHKIDMSSLYLRTLTAPDPNYVLPTLIFAVGVFNLKFSRAANRRMRNLAFGAVLIISVVSALVPSGLQLIILTGSASNTFFNLIFKKIEAKAP